LIGSVPGIRQVPSAAAADGRELVNVMTGKFATSRKSAERMSSSRLGCPELTLATSMLTVTVAPSGSSTGTVTVPFTAWNRPVTRATVMWRTENSTRVWAASIVQFPASSGARTPSLTVIGSVVMGVFLSVCLALSLNMVEAAFASALQAAEAGMTSSMNRWWEVAAAAAFIWP
jgi:hypothetical protein